MAPKRSRTESLGGPSIEKSSPAPSPSSSESFVDVLRDLSLSAGGYVGASSSLSMGRMLGSIVNDKDASLMFGGRAFDEYLSPKSNHATLDSIEERVITLAEIDDEAGERLLQGYFKHISTLWPLLRSRDVRRLHSCRRQLTDPFSCATLHLVYACGGRFLETTGETGDFQSEQHYNASNVYIDEVLQLHDIRSVQILLLLAIYSLRSPKSPGAWSFIGLAMRLSIDLGFHRRGRFPVENPSLLEMRKRVFWSCYCLDRQISIILGRPFAVSDRDIDAELPSDVDESEEDPAVLQMAASRTGQPAICSTSMSCFIHICRLRIIESNIQQNIYRVDQPDIEVSEIDKFLQQLEAWKEAIPQDAQRSSTSTSNGTSFAGRDYYMVYYYKCLRFLLHPHMSSPSPNLAYLQKCVEACGGVCKTYKRLHQNVAVGFSLMALHSVFFAGLTLLYCSWTMPKEIYTISTANDINACSIVLYVITERWPAARRYRDIFETIKQSVLDAIEEGEYCPRRPIKRLKANLQETLRNIQPSEGGRDDFSTLIAEMSANTNEQFYHDMSAPAFGNPGQTEFDFNGTLDPTSGGQISAGLDGDFNFFEQHQGQDWLLQADFDATAGFLLPETVL